MLDLLLEFDKQFFLLLNSLSHSSLDDLMVGISNRFIWIPFYLYMFYALVRNYRFKSLYIILFIVLLVTLTDQISVHFFKNVFERLRPCHEPSLEGMVNIVDHHCGGRYGFVSSHAANVFGLAIFLGHFLKRIDSWWKGILIIWATTVAFSRIYLGVHYPFDVICGAFLGIIIAKALLYLLDYLDRIYSLKLYHS